jgi:hypothetical protein
MLRDHVAMKRMFLLPLLCWACLAQATPPTVVVDDVRVHAGDDPAWSAPGFDDAAWTAQKAYRVDPQHRILWMRARVDAPAGADTVPLAVRVTMAGSWELYWNGTLLGRNGVPAATAAQEQPGRIKAEVYIPPGFVRERGNVLALRVSTHHLGLRLRAPVQRITFGEYSGTPGGRPGSGALALLAGGPLLLGGLYFAAMFLLDRRDHASLLLSLLAFAVLGQLLVESLRVFTAYPYPMHVPRLVAILCFAASSALLLIAYVAGQWAPRLRRPALLTALVALVAIGLLVGGFDGKTTLSLLAGLAIAFAVALVGACQRAEGARSVALVLTAVIGVLLLTIVIFIDLSYYLVATALLLFLFLRQAAVLRAAQLRSAQLEIELLKRQIQPHFLMNTLTALSEWIESSPRTGVKMIDALAAELRAVAAMSSAQLVPMRLELELCRSHLAVMGFQGNRTYRLVDDGVDPDGMVPPAIFHTLLENSLTHNRHADGAVFTLEERIDASMRIYTLRSPLGTEVQVGNGSGIGIGHAYVRARLRSAFAWRWRFDSRAVDGQWQDIVAVPCAS